MSRARYNFKDAADFLNECVPLSDLYEDVCEAMHNISAQRLSKERKDEIWHTLLTVADFLETIEVK